MAGAVIFDFYGTLAHWSDHEVSNYATVFAAHGYVLPEEEADAYFDRYNGVEHAAHSVSQEVYEAWVRQRLGDLTAACGVEPAHRELVVDALRASDQGPMVAYADAAPALRELRRQGWAIGVCSNWGWELDPFLQQVGLLDLVDAAVTSARAGARKPHPTIYRHSTDALGVDPQETVFVGDTWGPDVEGPRRAGMTAVHVWRAEERGLASPPELAGEGMHRIADLGGLLPLLDGALS